MNETLYYRLSKNLLLYFFIILFTVPSILNAQIDEQKITRFYQFGNDVSIYGEWAIVGNMWVDYVDNGGNTYDNAGAVYIFKQQPNGVWVQHDYFTEQCWFTSTGEQSGMYYGQSVAITDGWAVVGAPGYDSDDDGTIGPDGVVYVYKLDNNTDTWSLFTTLSEEIAVENQFGWDVDVEGNRIVIGDKSERHDNGAGVDQHNIGCAWVYNYDNGSNSWGSGTKLTASDGWGTPGGISVGPGDEFGSSVAVYDDNILIGAENKGEQNGIDQNKGGAYLFEWDGANWAETIFDPASLVISDDFGHSVAIRNNFFIVGAPGTQGSANATGKALVYKKSGANWNLLQTLTASDGQNGDMFGYSVGVGEVGSNIKFETGAPYWDGVSISNQGAIYTNTYDIVDNTFTESQLTASDAAAGDEFGYSLAIDMSLSSDNLVVGAWMVDDVAGGDKEGAVYFYSLRTATGGLWDGAVDTDWGNPANWTDNQVPNGVTDVVIPDTATNMPIVGDLAFCRNLNIETGATLGFSGTAGVLEINGDLDVYGNFSPCDNLSTINVHSTTTFSSSDPQNMQRGSYTDVYIDKARHDDVSMQGDVEILGSIYFPSGSDYFKADLIIGNHTITLNDYIHGNDRNLYGDQNSSIIFQGDPVIAYKIPGRISKINNITLNAPNGINDIGYGSIKIYGTLYLQNGDFALQSSEIIDFYNPIGGTIDNLKPDVGSSGIQIWIWGDTPGFTLPSTFTSLGSLINYNSQTITLTNDLTVDYALMLYNGEINTNGHLVGFAPTASLWSESTITFGNGFYDENNPPQTINIEQDSAYFNSACGSVDDLTLGPNALGTSIGSTGSITVSSSLSVSSGFTIESDATGSGSFIDNTSLKNRATVNANVETFLEAGQWHYVSSPVQSETADVFYFQGSSTTWMKYWDESTTSWQYITDLNSQLEVGKGYAVWVAQNRINETAVYSGNLNRGDKNINLSYSGTDKGWNLIGNPFPSSLDWDLGTWNQVNTTGVAYVWDNGNYVSRNSIGQGTLTDGIIPIGQGFFVQANAAAASINIPEDARVHQQTAFYKSHSKDDISNYLNISVSNGTVHDKTWISFNELATDGWDDGIDALRLEGSNESPQLFSMLNNEPMSIQVFAPIEYVYKDVDLYFKSPESSEYTLQFEGNNSFENTGIWLEDKQADYWVNLMEHDSYTFIAGSNDSPNRFVLHFSKGTTGIENEIAKSESLKIQKTANGFSIKTNDDSTIKKVEIYSVNSQLIYTKSNINSTYYNAAVPSYKSVLILRVYTDNEVITRKLIN